MLAQIVCTTLALTFADPSLVATVNKHTITDELVQLELALRTGHPEATPAARDAAIEQLIERALIQDILTQRKTTANENQLKLAIKTTQDALKQRKLPVPNEQTLTDYLSLPLAWDKYARRAITDTQIRSYYQEHQRQLDGTTLRVSQIFIRAPHADAQPQPEQQKRIEIIRQSIADKQISFADAAKQHSESPTASQGGDIGFIHAKGDLPQAVSHAAFELEQNGLSDVIPSPFGYHLIHVSEIKPGDLSLEDVRPAIFAQLSKQLWKETVAAQKPNATIERHDEKP